MALKILPEHVRSLLQSSSHINCYRLLIEELVYNALDAHTNSIAIRVNFEEESTQVVDNGFGIGFTDMNNLGKTHMTSKCISISTLKAVPDQYGYRGVALANIIAVSQQVKITSRYKFSEETWVKLFHNGKGDDAVVASSRPSKGTTVEIKGFLYNLAIQRKTLNPLHEMQDIKQFLEQLSFMHSNLSLSLRDDVCNEIIFQVRKSRDIYQKLRNFFDIDKKNIKELKVVKHNYKVVAYIGQDIDSPKHWIYLNGRYLDYCKLHKTVDEYLLKYLGKPCTTKHFKIKENNNQLPKKETPFYLVFLSCPYETYDLNQIPRKTILDFHNWQPVTSLLEKLVKFYFGDLKIKEYKKPENKVDTVVAVQDTRQKVKEIMERVLGNNAKISQVQNGIKGKVAKRKKIKKNDKKNKIVSLKFKEMARIIKSSCFRKSAINDITSQTLLRDLSKSIEQEQHQKDDVTVDKIIPVKCIEVNKETNNINLPKQSCTKLNYKVNKKIKKHKKEKKIIELKDNKLYDLALPLEHVINSNNERCKIISDNTNLFLSESYRKYFKRNTETVKIIKNKINVSITRNVDKVIGKDDGISVSQALKRINILEHYIDNCIDNHNIGKQFQSREDLIHTVLNSQNALNKENNLLKFLQPYIDNKEVKNIKQPIIPLITSNNNNFKNVNNIFTYQGYPMPTYESHNYNIQDYDETFIHSIFNNVNGNNNYNQIQVRTSDSQLNNNIRKSYLRFLTKESREKLITPIGKQNKLYYRGKNSIKITIPNRNKETKQFTINKSNMRNKLSYTIDYSGSGMNNKFKHIFNSIISSISNTYNQFEINKKRFDKTLIEHKNKQNFRQITETKNVNTKIIAPIDVAYYDEIISNSYESSQFHPKRTAVNQLLQTSKDDVDYINNREHNFMTLMQNRENVISKSNDKSIEKEFIDPLNVCEVIMRSTDLFDIENNKNPKESSTNNLQSQFNINYKDLLNNNNSGEPKKKSQLCDGDTDLGQYIENNFSINSNSENGISCRENPVPLHSINKDTDSDKREKSVQSHKKNTFYANLNQMEINKSILESDRNFYNSELPNNGASLMTSKIVPSNSKKKRQSINRETFDNAGQHSLQKEAGVIDEKNTCMDSQTFNLEVRPRFIPKGLSPLLRNCNTRNDITYENNNYNNFNNAIYDEFEKCVQIGAEVFEANVQIVNELTTKEIVRATNRIKKDNANVVFDKRSLTSIKVLGQVDDKFIAVKILGRNVDSNNTTQYMVLFDQHAVHERIRLEDNLKEYMCNGKWKAVPLDSFSLILSTEEVLYLHNYKDKFLQFGLKWTSLNDREISIHAIPQAILGKNFRHVEIIIKAVKKLIHEQVKAIRDQKGSVPLYPQTIMELMFSEACSYAIKFGDRLSRTECSELLSGLQRCKTPYQCAHGRPALALLFQLQADTHTYDMDLAKLSKFRKTAN